jgi:hypothetical protein
MSYRKKLRNKRCPICIKEGVRRLMTPCRIGDIRAIYWWCYDCKAYLAYAAIRREDEVERFLRGEGEFKVLTIRDC